MSSRRRRTARRRILATARALRADRGEGPGRDPARDRIPVSGAVAVPARGGAQGPHVPLPQRAALAARRPGGSGGLPAPPADLADHQPDADLLRRVHALLRDRL
ncbi:hypothetical protein [Streptomyces sp. NPDC047000]|uniref:hypothetical protein n=1 Tax=Streptomyces sp. NPDC047000 TaxID=3155474 RepID=UPI003409BA94